MTPIPWSWIAELSAFAAACTASLGAQQWVPIDQAPAPRQGLSMVTDTVRNRVVMFGGEGREDTWYFDGSYWTQVLTDQKPPNYVDYAVAFDAGRARVVMFGGRDPSVSWPLPDDTWEFDGSTWLRVPTTLAPTSRTLAAMAYDAARGEVILFGGWDALPGPPLADTWAWNGTNWNLRSPATSPPGMYRPAMAYDAVRQRLVLVDTYFPATWEWDGATWQQVPTPMSPPLRAGAGLVYRPDIQRVMMFGGQQGPNPPLLDDTWTFDGVTWTQQTTTNVPPARAFHGAAWDPVSARAIVFGGLAVAGSGIVRGDTWALDGNTWTEVPMPEEPRSVQGMTYDSARGRFVALTGNQVPAATWEFDGRWHRMATPVAPAYVWWQPIVYDSLRHVSVTYTGFPLQTWEWNGTTWSSATTVHAPPARTSQAMAFDPLRGVVVLFGGTFAQNYDDTWEFDGIDWKQVQLSVHPPSLRRAAMAFHAPSNRIVMFGGGLPSGMPTDETWEYDGVLWTHRLPATQPPRRAGAAFVHDPWTGHLILAGGNDNYPSSTLSPRDSWAWDGNNWTATPPQSIYAVPWQTAAADPFNAMMCDGERWWRWTPQAAVMPTTSGTGCGSPAPELVIDSRPFLGNPFFRLSVEPTEPDALFAMFAAVTPTVIALGGGCEQYLASPFLFCIGCSTPTGHGQTTAPIPRMPALRGMVLHLQGLASSSTGPLLGVIALTARRTLVLGD